MSCVFWHASAFIGSSFCDWSVTVHPKIRPVVIYPFKWSNSKVECQNLLSNTTSPFWYVISLNIITTLFYHTHAFFRKRKCPASARRWADVGLECWTNFGLMSRFNGYIFVLFYVCIGLGLFLCPCCVSICWCWRSFGSELGRCLVLKMNYCYPSLLYYYY